MAKRIITISREYGSGGRAVGKLVAEEMGYAFYDKEIIALVAKESGLSLDYVEETEESYANRLGFKLAMGDSWPQTGMVMPENMSIPDQIMVLQSRIIRQIAEKGPCVIVGRSADYILEDRDDCLNVFIHADLEPRVKRAIRDYGVEEAGAVKEVEKKDKLRANHYRHYTGRPWGDARNYHVALDSGEFGLEECARIIVKIARRY